jgi:hypothetical protein
MQQQKREWRVGHFVWWGLIAVVCIGWAFLHFYAEAREADHWELEADRWRDDYYDKKLELAKLQWHLDEVYEQNDRVCDPDDL